MSSIMNSENALETRSIGESQSEYSEICLPNDTNLLGNMLGGHVMHLVDLCGAIAGMRHARSMGGAPADRQTEAHFFRVFDLRCPG